MSPLSAVALLVLCATPSFTSPSGFHQSSSFSSGYQAAASSNNAPVVLTKSSYKGCSSATGCGSVTLENGKITESSGNPVALGLVNGETPESLDPAELHKKFALQAENINSAFGSNLPLNGPLWWMGKDSPFKDSFEAYQKFIKENGLTIPQFPTPCGTPSCPFAHSNNKQAGNDDGISNSIDSNPFLNGQFASAAGFASNGASAGFESSKNKFGSGNINLPGFASHQIGSHSFTSNSENGGMNLDANIFLNGALSGSPALGCNGGKAGSCGGSSGTLAFNTGKQQVNSGFQQNAGQQHGNSGFQQNAGQHTQSGFQQNAGQHTQSGFQQNAGQHTQPGFQQNAGQHTQSGFQQNAGQHTQSGFQQNAGQHTQPGFQQNAGQHTQSGFQQNAGQHTQSGFQQNAGQHTQSGFQQVTGQQQVNTGFPNQGQQQISTSFDQTQTTGCGNDGSGCGFQDQQQVVSGFDNVQTGCSGPFCGQDQQVITHKPIPQKPPHGLPHPPGATAGGFKNSDAGTSGELTVTCTGQGYICVDKSLCLNGFVNDNGENILLARSGVRCKASTEVCCRFKPKEVTQTTAQAYDNRNTIQSGSKVESSSFHSTGSGLVHVPGSPNENLHGVINAKHQGTTQTGYDQQSYNSFQSTKPTNQINPPFLSTGQGSTYSKDATLSQTLEQTNRRPKLFENNANRPGTPYLPPDEPKPYVYPEPEKPFYPTTQKPYTPYVAPTTRPTTPYVPYIPPTQKTTRYIPPAPTTARPTGRPYLPPRHDESPQPSFGSQQIVPRPILENEGGIVLDETRFPPQPKENIPPAQIPSACAAALKCTPIEFCSADGVISNTSIILTKEQQTFRVPLTDCREPSTGIIGKCCRDPTYTDPWPTNQLGRWIPEAFGDTGAYRADQHRPAGNPNGGANGRPTRPVNPGFGINTAGSINNPIYAANPNQINPSVQLQTPVNPGAYVNVNQQKQTPRVPSYQPGQTITPVKGGVNKPSFTAGNFGNYNVPNSQVNTANQHSTGELLLSNFAQGKQQNVNFKAQASGTCGARRTGTQPYGNKNQFESDFAEIPWQAMVLLQTNRSLLCGGVITADNIVVTSAHCIDGLEASNVLIKGGEWKLGIDEEPLPFQIVQVAKIHKHPEYFTGSLQNDFAVLILAEKLRLAPNIEPICLPPANENAEARLYSASGHQCITTGWGKQVLQINIPNSVMHTLDMNLIPPQQCQAQISQNYPHLLDNYNQNTCICGQPSQSGANVCKVDVGSALACTSGDGVYYMEGVYSWDSGCTSPNQLASFYKFDATWYHSAITGQTNVQAQVYQQQQQFGGGNNNGGHFNAQAQAQQQNQQQGQYSTQYKQTVYKQGRSYAVNGQKAFEQAINGHVHSGGEPCQCNEEGK